MASDMIGKSSQVVVDTLQQKIALGVYKAGDFLGTELKLAGEFKVSRTTVRTAMAYLEKQRVVKRGDSKGFVLASKDSGTASQNDNRPDLLLIRAANKPLDNEIFSGVTTSPLAGKFNITLLDATGRYGNYADILNHMPEKFRHVLLFPLDIPEVESAIENAIARGVSIVQLDRYIERISAPAVIPDHFSGAYEGTRSLLLEHNRPVYYFGNNALPTSAALRFAGWKSAMHEFGYDDVQRFMIGEFSPKDSDLRLDAVAEGIFETFIKKHRHEPISVFAISDSVALFIYRCCERLGIKIGENVFVMGFDNEELCERLSPTMSTIAVDRRAIGAEALRLLVEGQQEIACGFWRRLIPVKLIVRQSSVKRTASIREKQACTV